MNYECSERESGKEERVRVAGGCKLGSNAEIAWRQVAALEARQRTGLPVGAKVSPRWSNPGAAPISVFLLSTFCFVIFR
jgi:hypothetical protein